MDVRPPPLRLAVWSGPRNVSTALMRSFDSRADTVVCDEPLYAFYLKATGRPHPMAGEIVARHESDWRAVVEWLTGPLPAGKSVFYQKHMAHHLLAEVGRDWLAALTHVFLVREPGEMLTSLLAILPEPGLEDTGYPQQVELFRAERARTGGTPAVVDARDLLRDPEAMLRALCARVGLAFDPAMLSWEPGVRPTDGCWAEAWYGSALRSTGFRPYREREARVPGRFRGLEEACLPLYQELWRHRLLP